MTDLYDLPGHLIRRLHQISVAIFAAKVAAAGFDITPVQFAALAVINRNPGIDQVTLAGLIAYDPVTIGGVVDRLCQKGLVHRTVSKSDRRARVLELTDEGSSVLARVLPAIHETQRLILGGLSDDERAQFVPLLRKVTEAGNDLSRAPLRPVRSPG
ncbi:MAG TPA: MarR family transcriptional regulator [Paracoccaceae bacterium]|nr:MarR family transcriptional regulator [Paracoccaceae bacterium]